MLALAFILCSIAVLHLGLFRLCKSLDDTNNELAQSRVLLTAKQEAAEEFMSCYRTLKKRKSNKLSIVCDTPGSERSGRFYCWPPCENGYDGSGELCFSECRNPFPVQAHLICSRDVTGSFEPSKL